MIKRSYSLEFLSSVGILMFLFFYSKSSFGQIYETTRIDEYKVSQYDTLNVETVKEYLFSGRMKDLLSKKKYDEDGFIVEQSDYSKEGKRNRLVVFKTYTYNSDRTECIEVWIDPSNSDRDTTFIKTQTYDSKGKILKRTEVKSYSGERSTFDYNYDDYGNCESIRCHGGYRSSVEFFKNDYDSLGRIVRQVHTHRIGVKYERLRVYNSAGQIERNSIDDGQLVEVFSYNDKGDVLRRNYTWDSTMINIEAIYAKTCVEGTDYFDYDQQGRLISVQNDCETFVNKNNAFINSVGNKYEYDERGLLMRRITVCGDCPEEYADVIMGYMFEYKFHTKKRPNN